MEWVHDLGGRTGHGTVDVEQDEPVFHAPWERVARGLTYATLMSVDGSSISLFRHAIERMDPDHYLSSSYYEHWFTAAATLVVESGLVDADELARRAGGPVPLSRPDQDPDVAQLGTGEQRFAVGDPVRVRPVDPQGHCRCPAYTRGREGVVVSTQGVFSLPDVEAHATRRVREAVYTVRFRAVDLWEDGDPSASVNVGLWDSYLEAA